MLKVFSFFCKRAQNIVPIVTDLEGAKGMVSELEAWIHETEAKAAPVVSELKSGVDAAAKIVETVVPAVAPEAVAVDAVVDEVASALPGS